MTYYGPKELAESFRTVRKNTIQIAEDIPEEKYGFRATPDTKSVAEILRHIAVTTSGAHETHAVERPTFLSFEDFAARMQKRAAEEALLTTKAQIIDALKRGAEQWASFLESAPEALLAERVGFPPPVTPPSKSRFEMILSVKEHEMHERAKLMVMERMLGIVPHLTRQREAFQQAAPGQAARA